VLPHHIRQGKEGRAGFARYLRAVPPDIFPRCKKERKMTICKRCGVLSSGEFGDRKKEYNICNDCIQEIKKEKNMKKETRFTKWEAINRGSLSGRPKPRHLIIDENGETVVIMPDLSDRSYKNAAQIVQDHSAAPDMLEALKSVVPYLYKMKADGIQTAIPVNNMIMFAEAVIKKALGE